MDSDPSSPRASAQARVPSREDSPGSSEPAPSSEARIYLHDHNNKAYIIPYERGKDWTQFKSFLEEVYSRPGHEEHLESIRDGKFDAEIGLSKDDVALNVVLPSVWADVIVPGAIVHIGLWSERNRSERLRGARHIARSRTGGVEFADPEIEWEDEWRPPLKRTTTSDERRPSDLRRATTSDEWYLPRRRATGSDDGRPPPPAPTGRQRSTSPGGWVNEGRREDLSESTSDEETDEESTYEDTGKETESLPKPEPVRVATQALDRDDNELAFTVDTKWVRLHSNAGVDTARPLGTSKTPENGREMDMERLNILKAVIVTSEGRTKVQLCTLPGPESSLYASSIGIRWCHVHAEQLDWTNFKSVCVGLPGLTERLQKVITKTLMKVEKEHLKAFQGGLFIDPGTVLRGDDADKTEPSVIFSCIPHFDLRKPLRSTATSTDRLAPPRTLMQSYYPYEPVQERDQEQAFRRFGNAKNDLLVHVPSMWMVNIGSHIVVTAGYQSLTSTFVKSIALQPEDLNMLGASVQANTLTTVRLTDWNGRVLLYRLDEIRSYFQLEQRLRELRAFPNLGSSLSAPNGGLHLALKSREGADKIIEIRDWPQLINHSKELFIDLIILDDEKAKSMFEDVPQSATLGGCPTFTKTSVPPFFDWPLAAKDECEADSTNDKRTIRCLETVEKDMRSESLLYYETIGPVDQTFTSSNYYDTLATTTVERLQQSLLSATQDSFSKVSLSHATLHQSIVQAKHKKLVEKTKDFIAVVQETMELFVSDLDHTAVIGKVWGAMTDLVAITGRLKQAAACASDPAEFLDRNWKCPLTGQSHWRIRAPATPNSNAVQQETLSQLPEADTEFVSSLKRCKRCKRPVDYDSPNEALEHLRHHLKKVDPGAPDNLTQVTPAQASKLDKLKDWIRNSDEAHVEDSLAGAVVLLQEGTKAARNILEQLRELVYGVRNEDGNKSDIYTFPRKLLETLHRLVVFYIAVERSLYFTEQAFKTPKEVKQSEELPYSEDGLAVLKRFVDGAKRPLAEARLNLCYMARTSDTHNYWKRLSLGPEYICAWLMRRLIVKPLDQSMTIADMYREYLSTLQFQVNHRPGKRLLRSINLLQEELQILVAVNDWQVRLVENYMRVLDDETYPTEISTRRALFPHERLLLKSCLENLASTREEYDEQISRSGPLILSTKQSAEINEEDHGKAILVFTVVTIIFLPLSFVTSYLGMNTVDIRDMNNNQALFWEIAIPLTIVVLVSITFVAYNGDDIRDRLGDIYRTIAGKQNRSTSARGISVAQRKRAARRPSDSTTTLDSKSLADEAEYAAPKPDYWNDFHRSDHQFTVDKGGYSSYPVEEKVIPPTFLRSSRIRTDAPAPNVRIYSEDPVYADPPSVPEPKLLSSSPHQVYRPTLSNDQPSPEATRPTYMRINRAYILPETIASYGLPWQFDPDDLDYVLIKKSLTQAETDVLFEHTKRLRELGVGAEDDAWYSRPKGRTGRSGRTYGEPYNDWGNGDDGLNRKEYTWVRKTGRRGPRRVRSRR